MWIFLCLLIVTASNALAQDESGALYLGNFGGLDTFHDSTRISDIDAQDAENVITENGRLEKRTGNDRLTTILNGYAVKYVAEFLDNSANRYLIAHSSLSIYQTNLASSPVSIGTTTAGQNIDSVTGFNRHWIADGRNAIWGFDGTSTMTARGAPLCNFIEFADERLYCANTPDSPSTVYVSSFGGVDNWTIPIVEELPADAPNAFTFRREDGESVTCLKSTPWGEFVGKHHFTGYIKGQNNDSYYKGIISPVVGCVDDRSVQMVDGLLVWMALDGLYSWDGTGAPEPISSDIQPTIDAIRQLNSTVAQWIVDSQADWERGRFETNGGGNAWSSTIASGEIQPSSTTFHETEGLDWDSGTSVNLSTLAVTGSLVFIQSGGGTADGKGAFLNAGAESNNCTNWANCGFALYSAGDCASGGVGGTYGWEEGPGFATCPKTLTVRLLDSSSNTIHETQHSITAGLGATTNNIDISTFPQVIKVQFLANTSTSNISSAFIRGNKFGYCYEEGSLGNCNASWDIREDATQVSGNYTSKIYDTTFSSAASYVNIAMSSASGTNPVTFLVRGSTSGNGGGFESVQPQSNLNVWAGNSTKRYRVYIASFGSVGSSTSTSLASINDVSISFKSTGPYYSEVKQIGSDITSWKTIDFNDSQSETYLSSYSVRVASWSFPITEPASIIPWIYQPNHQIVKASTNTYFQFRVLNEMSSASQTISVAKTVTNWQEGTDVPLASVFKDHRYILSVSTYGITNNLSLVWQKNKKFTQFTGPSYASLNLFNNKIIAGDGSTNSRIWNILQPDTYSDDGVPISAFWVSKDFTMQSPNTVKQIRDFYIESVKVSSMSIDVGYAINKSTTFTNVTVDLGTTGNAINKRIPMANGYDIGKYFKFRFYNGDLDEYFKINALTVPYTIEKAHLGDE